MVSVLRFDGSVDMGASDAWQRTIHDVFGDVELTIPDRATFNGTIRSAPVASIEINTVGCSYEDARRTKAQAARSADASFALSFVLGGRLTLEQFDRTCMVERGQWVLFDLGAPYSYRHAGWTDVLSIKLPQALLEARLGRCHGQVARAGRGDQGIARVTRDALASLANEAASLEPHIAEQCAGRMIDLIAMAIDAGPAADVQDGNVLSRAHVYRRLVAYIDAHSHDCDLDAARIAAAHRISVRSLQKIFQEHGCSIGDAVRTRRLERCHRELKAARSRSLAIKDIALRAGFRNPSHFATAFRREYGVTPTDHRHASLN